jgi:inward rectifier potassium channel
MDAKTPPPPAAPPPVIKPDGRVNVVAIGRPRRILSDAYVRLMRMHWSQLVCLFTSSFLLFNLVFAFLYWLVPNSLGSAGTTAPGSFFNCFFFSVQTVATIGYGVLYPNDLYANVLVTLEITLGVMGFAVGNGLMFARFSRPTARIAFTDAAVVVPHNGVPTLMFRAANERHNLILETHVRVSLLRNETSQEGRTMRRFRDLPLERQDNPTFILSWTVMHPIDEVSPFFGMGPEDLADSDLEIVVVMTGTDQSFAQTVSARHVYRARDIVWGKAFADIVSIGADGRRIIDYAKFNELEPIG